MKIYVLIRGETFEEAKEAHGDKFFSSIEEAVLWCQINLDLGEKFFVCDENGGLLYVGFAPRLVGRA